MNTIVARIILHMREFQKNNNVIRQCLTNTQYLYDCVKMNTSLDVKAKAFIIYIEDFEKRIIKIINHLALIIDNKIIESSYEVFKLKNIKYFDTIQDLNFLFMDKEFKKTIIKNHLKFVENAERINNGVFSIANYDFYIKQADYVEMKMKIKNI